MAAYSDHYDHRFHSPLLVIAQSFLARTFGTYTSQLFNVEDTSLWAAILGVWLLLVARQSVGQQPDPGGCIGTGMMSSYRVLYG